MKTIIIFSIIVSMMLGYQLAINSNQSKFNKLVIQACQAQDEYVELKFQVLELKSAIKE